MLSIIIPHHTAPLEIMHPLLSSIDNQVGIDFNSVEILIINDVEESVITDFSAYKNIKNCIRNIPFYQGGGPGPSRQKGIDECKGEYILFCDDDDSLASSLLFYDLAITMGQNPGVDLFDYKFVEETENSRFIPHEANATWVFSKVYRKGFLDEHKIRFHPTLFYQEDSYFNQIVIANNPNRYYMNQYMTVWRYNKNSITRKDQAEYTYSQFHTWLESLTLAEMYIRDTLPNVDRREALLDILCSTYCQIQNFDLDRMAKYSDKIKEAIKAFIKEFNLRETFFSNVTQQDISIIYGRMAVHRFIPREGFMQFYSPILEEIDEEVKNIK